MKGIGAVVGVYEYAPDDPDQKHHLPVSWKWVGDEVWKGHPGYMTTVTDFTNKPEAVAFVNAHLKTGLPDETTDTKTVTLSRFPLNTILYGPPGTGKTYETARRAVTIVDGSAPDDRRELMERYKELVGTKRIGFVTFHQSYSYEDFVEGIRPVMDGAGESGPRYSITDGVLKEVALYALGASLRLVTRSTESGPSFPALWQLLGEKIEDNPEWTIPGVSASSKYRLSVTGAGTLRGENIIGNAQSPYTASRKNVEKVWNELPAEMKPTHNKLFEIIGVGSHTNLIGAVILTLRDLAKALPVGAPLSEPPAREKASSFLEGGDRDLQFFREAPRFVLIVDEINRGNVSKILGELITLLEEDKRIGAENELVVTLPYSREAFALPSNLYIIGTMNTADKSLALLDIALRRRFVFDELTTNFALCKSLSPVMQQALNELNRRITLRKDRDHRIGHAYFIRCESEDEFNAVFQRRIIPLLQDYFFNDWGGLMYVLNETGANAGFIRPLGDASDSGARNKWQWYSDVWPAVALSPLAQLAKNYKCDGASGVNDINGDSDDA